jgi:hypothetical protein
MPYLGTGNGVMGGHATTALAPGRSRCWRSRESPDLLPGACPGQQICGQPGYPAPQVVASGLSEAVRMLHPLVAALTSALASPQQQRLAEYR